MGEVRTGTAIRHIWKWACPGGGGGGGGGSANREPGSYVMPVLSCICGLGCVRKAANPEYIPDFETEHLSSKLSNQPELETISSKPSPRSTVGALAGGHKEMYGFLHTCTHV